MAVQLTTSIEIIDQGGVGTRTILTTITAPNQDTLAADMESKRKAIEQGRGVVLRTGEKEWTTIPPNLIVGPLVQTLEEVEEES